MLNADLMPTNSIEYRDDGIYYNGKLVPDIASMPEKTVIDENDIILIEDSADSNNKKKVTKTNFLQLDSGDISDFVDSSGDSGYIKIGNMMIQWGETSNLTTSLFDSLGNLYHSPNENVSFPQPFKTGSNPKITLGLGGPSASGGCWANSHLPSNTGFISRLIGWSNSESATIQWIAIGVYQ